MSRQGQSYPTTVEFEKHSENLTAIRKFRIQIERLHKSAIRRNAAPEISALARTQYLTVGVEAEAVLRKIVADPTGFNDNERAVIWGARSRIDQWLKVLELAFRRHYAVLIHRSLESALPAGPLQRYQTLYSVINDDLRPIVEQRNKIAHGQWVWHLRSGREDFFTASGPHDSTPDYLTLSLYTKMLAEIAGLVLFLVVSRPTFEREFNSGYARFDMHRNAIAMNSNGVAYQNFVKNLQATRLKAAAPPNP